jgi:hypothetical protein
MKTLLIAFLLFASNLFATTLVWDASPASEQVEQYVVYEKQNNGEFIEVARTVLPAYPLQGAAGPKTYVVTAVNVQGLQSEPSNEASLLGKPSKLGNARIIK